MECGLYPKADFVSREDIVSIPNLSLTMDHFQSVVLNREASLPNPYKTDPQHRVGVAREFPMPNQQTSHA